MLKPIALCLGLVSVATALILAPLLAPDCQGPATQEAMQAFVRTNTFAVLASSRGSGTANALGEYWISMHDAVTVNTFAATARAIDNNELRLANTGRQLPPLVAPAKAMAKVKFEGPMTLEVRGGESKGQASLCNVRFPVNALMPADFVDGNVPDSIGRPLHRFSGRSRIMQTVETTLKVEAPFNGWLGLRVSAPKSQYSAPILINESVINESFSDSVRAMNLR